MVEIVKNISNLIESQFPDIYKEAGQQLITFLQAYYEFLESNSEYSTNLSRNMFTIRDIDTTLEEFVVYFKEKYLKDFPFVSATDKRLLIKNVLDLYRSKGSERAVALLMNILFEEYTTEVYVPGMDVLRPSDSIWKRPIYLELTPSSRSGTFVGKQITGSNSGAKAFLEGIVTKRVDGKLIDIGYLSSVQGQFRINELITDDGNSANAPKVIGSLTNVDLVLGGRNNSVGDVFNVITSQGRQGKVRVTDVVDATGRVDFEIVLGGSGYTNTQAPDLTASDVYVATAMLEVENSSLDFIDLETVVQRIETVTTLSSSDINSNWAPGDFVIGINDPSNTAVQVANGIVISVANTDSEGNVIGEPSANSVIKIQALNGTTFNTLRRLVTANSAQFAVGEYVEEENAVTIDTDVDPSIFNIGEVVFQEVRDNVSNNIIQYAFGTVDSIDTSNNEINLIEAWGTFEADLKITSKANNAAFATVSGVLVTAPGARGQVVAVAGDDVSTRDIFGDFTVSKKIRGDKTLLIDTINEVIDSGATDIWLNGNSAANGVIDTIANNYSSGFLIGQNTSTIGLYGNTNPFYFIDDGSNSMIIETNREELISPPRDANGAIIELEKPILDIKTGNDATFRIGLIEDTETVTLNTDLVGGQNIYGVDYVDVKLDASGSGIGFIDSITINDGGTLYANGGVVTFDGGGYADGDPLIEALGVIETDAGGTITSITMFQPGEGYYSTPEIVLPSTSGSVANVEINTDFGYGFPKEPSADPTTLLINALTNEDFEIGTIASLTGINPGANYNVDPFVRVRNKYIASFARKNFFLYVTNIIGSFVVGESLLQVIGPSETAKGQVLAFLPTGAAEGLLLVERTSFDTAFTSGIDITGDETGATASIDLAITDEQSLPMGDNSIITGTAINAQGVATGLEVIDSGYGYFPDGEVTLEREGFPFIITGISKVINQGIGTGFWASTTSHLNSEKKIHDNKYYQEFSYDIQSGLSLNRYVDIIKQTIHVSGNEIFGSVVKTSTIQSPITVADSSREII